ncbi:MAG: ketoacyl-ACP synthase III family protein [Frankiaceae bacterium]
MRAVLHSYVDYQGARYWQAAPYVAMHTVGASVPSFDVVQECNGAMASIELGRRFVTGPDDAVLVTTGDRFDNPWVRRWYGDQSVLADGGSAMVLSGAGGFARVTSLITLAENSLEAEARGGAFWSGADLSVVDFEKMRSRYFKAHVPMLEHYARLEGLLHECVGKALADAGVTVEHLAYVIPVVTTAWRTQIQLERLLGLPIERSTWDFGRTTGHIGTGDQIIGLHHLVTTGKVRPGDRVLLIGGGTGYTVTAAVLEIVEEV